MNSEPHVEELIVWYALGTLTPSERAAVEQHLATCAHCRRLATEAEGTVNMLPQTVEPIAPSPQLKRKLMSRIDADLAASRVPADASPIGWSERLGAFTRRWSPAFALASLVLVLLVGWWNWTLQSQLNSALAELALVTNPRSREVALPTSVVAPKDAQAKLHIPPNSNSALLSVAGLKRLGADKTYEFWLIRGAQPIPAGTFNVDENGNARVSIESAEPISNFDQAGVTIEKAGGALAPTMDQLVFVGSIKP